MSGRTPSHALASSTADASHSFPILQNVPLFRRLDSCRRSLSVAIQKRFGRPIPPTTNLYFLFTKQWPLFCAPHAVLSNQGIHVQDKWFPSASSMWPVRTTYPMCLRTSTRRTKSKAASSATRRHWTPAPQAFARLPCGICLFATRASPLRRIRLRRSQNSYIYHRCKLSQESQTA